MTAVASNPPDDRVQQIRPVILRDGLRALATPVEKLQGVGPKRAELLHASGLSTVEDILYHLPFRYEDRRQLKKIAAAVLGQEESFIGELVMLQSRFIPRRRWW